MKLLYDSPLYTTEGITKAARDYIKALDIAGMEVCLTDYMYKSDIAPELKKYHTNVIDFSKEHYVVVKNTRPEMWPYWNFPNLFGFHVLEGDKWPTDQVEGINNSKILALLVPSLHCKETAKNSGVTKDIEVIPHIIDAKFNYKKKEKSDITTFFYSAAIFGVSEKDRKGLDILMNAWETFKDRKDVKLIIKINSTYAVNVYAQKGQRFNFINYLNTLINYDLPDNIEIIDKNVSEDELINIYHNVDCILYPTRGEGFGLVPFEGLACGTPCIVTEKIGCDTYLNEDIGGFLKIKLSGLSQAEKRYPYFDPKTNKTCNWVEPDLNDFVTKIKMFIDSKDKFIEEAALHSAYIRDEYSYKKIGELYKLTIYKYIDI